MAPRIRSLPGKVRVKANPAFCNTRTDAWLPTVTVATKRRTPRCLNCRVAAMTARTGTVSTRAAVLARARGVEDTAIALATAAAVAVAHNSGAALAGVAGVVIVTVLTGATGRCDTRTG